MTLRNAFDSLAVETTQQEILSELQTQQKNSLTNSELRASPVPVSTGLVQPTTPTDIQPVSVNNLPLPNGAATAAKQLPDNHNVTVSNQVQQPLTDSQLRFSPVPVNTGLQQPTTPTDVQPVSATNLPLPTGAATAAKQLPDNHNVTVSNFPAVQTITGVVSLDEPSLIALENVTINIETGASLRVNNESNDPIPVNGTVNIQDNGGSITVDGPLTNSELRASPINVSTGLQQPTTPTDTQPVSAASLPLPVGAATDSKLEQIRILLNEIELNQLANNHQVSVSNFPLVFPLTDAQVTLLRTSKLDEALQNGVAYTGGGKISVTNNTAVLQLANPAGSGKIIIVGQFFLASDQNIDIQFRRNATVNNPSLQTSDPLNLGSVVPAVGVLRTGSTGYSSAGSLFSPIGRLAANITASYTLPLILPPGTSVSASFAAGALTSISCYASAAWIESPI